MNSKKHVHLLLNVYNYWITTKLSITLLLDATIKSTNVNGHLFLEKYSSTLGNWMEAGRQFR